MPNVTVHLTPGLNTPSENKVLGRHVELCLAKCIEAVDADQGDHLPDQKASRKDEEFRAEDAWAAASWPHPAEAWDWDEPWDWDGEAWFEGSYESEGLDGSPLEMGRERDS